MLIRGRSPMRLRVPSSVEIPVSEEDGEDTWDVFERASFGERCRGFWLKWRDWGEVGEGDASAKYLQKISFVK